MGRPSKEPVAKSSTPTYLVFAALLIVMIGFAVWYMNQGYGKTSERGYEFATALFSACNQQDEAKLNQISGMIDQSLADDELTAADARVLRSIVSRAQAGRWDSASSETRKLMEAQLTPVELP